MSKIRKAKKKRTKRGDRKDELKQLRARLARTRREERIHLATLRDRRQNAKDKGNDERAEMLADKIDATRGEIRHLKDRIESTEARLLKVSSAIKRLTKRIKRLAKKARRRKHYASKHFAYSEFDCNDGTRIPEASKPALRHLCANYLEPLRAKYGSVHINSGYRHRAYNAAIGGATYSQHIYDDGPDDVAADHTCSGASPGTVYAFLDALGPGGLGRYSSFTHVDNRPGRSRWSG